jgi:hypothetical protein
MMYAPWVESLKIGEALTFRPEPQLKNMGGPGASDDNSQSPRSLFVDFVKKTLAPLPRSRSSMYYFQP